MRDVWAMSDRLAVADQCLDDTWSIPGLRQHLEDWVAVVIDANADLDAELLKTTLVSTWYKNGVCTCARSAVDSGQLPKQPSTHHSPCSCYVCLEVLGRGLRKGQVHTTTVAVVV